MITSRWSQNSKEPNRTMNHLMTKEESYADRRKLFKNIWATAMHMDAKDTDIMSKPKVIKTLRLDQVDRCVIGKSKKQRIKNLRNVCNKLLDFCDRQDADDLFYEQMPGNHTSVQEPPHNQIPSKVKKTARNSKKVKKTKSCSPNSDFLQATVTISEDGQNRNTTLGRKTTRITLPNKFKRSTVVKKVPGYMTSRPRTSPTRVASNVFQFDISESHRKVIKTKSRSKKMKNYSQDSGITGTTSKTK